ncbi:hypothetical protein [Mucilaginibacter sp.]
MTTNTKCTIIEVWTIMSLLLICMTSCLNKNAGIPTTLSKSCHYLTLNCEKLIIVDTIASTGDHLDYPYLKLSLTITNNTSKKILYTCKSSARDSSFRSSMLVMSRQDAPSLFYIDAYDIEFISPHSKVQVTGIINAALCSKILHHPVLRHTKITMFEARKLYMYLRKATLIYQSYPDDLTKYKQMFDSTLYMPSDTVLSSLAKVRMYRRGKELRF